ncbi:MAG TPA: extracellular solute-binding protein, partial [Chloroflexota bacterium]|nr:extracellular solute-binding protein [Chloroflexota bacterium]
VANYPQPANGNEGNVGIWHAPPGTVSVLKKRVGDAFQWATAHLPKGKQHATTVGGHCLAVLKTGRHHEQAWRFVQWFTSPPIEAEFLVASYTLPPWRSAERQQVWQQFVREEPRIKPFVEMLSYARPTPKVTRWQDIIGLLAQERDAAAAQKKTPREALEDAARAAQPLLDEG